MLLTVAAAGGDHTTVRDALAAAEPGARIVVRAGRYVGDLRVDYALRGVRLDAGTHVVEWELECRPLQAGGAITLVALLAAAMLVIKFRRAPDRRSRRG